MKRLLVLAALALGGCAAFKPGMPRAPATPQLAAAYTTAASQVQVERVPFKLGVSSATVERLAKEQGCASGSGAGLVTEPGPVEVYRVQCEGGKVFMARCELRQCKRM